MKKIIYISTLILLFTCSINAQTKNTDSLRVTLDCANPDNRISVRDLKNCKKLVLKGANHEDFVIIQYIISKIENDSLKQYQARGDELFKEAISEISKVPAGEQIFLEEVKIQSIKDKKIIKTLKTTHLFVK